jgi:hypothetical protein
MHHATTFSAAFEHLFESRTMVLGETMCLLACVLWLWARVCVCDVRAPAAGGRRGARAAQSARTSIRALGARLEPPRFLYDLSSELISDRLYVRHMCTQ